MSGGDKYIVTEVLTSISMRVICRQIAVPVLWLFILRKQCTYCIIVSTCSIDVIIEDLTGLTFFCLRLTVCQALNFVFLHGLENSYSLFHSRFSLFLFVFLVFQLTIFLFEVKAWYFYCGKCFLAVWL